MSEMTCPECGCPIGNDNVCPECGYTVENAQPTPGNEDSPTTSNFNEEEEPYTPFSPTSWVFRTPTYLNKYPERGDFAKAHPFLGWLFNPWHVSFKGNGNRAAFDSLNNIFLFFNLLWKTCAYTFVWTFLKLFWPVVIVAVVIFLLGMVFGPIFGAGSGLVALVILIIPGLIVNLCGLAVSLRRYISAIYDTYMRICKRFWMSVAKSVKENNLNV